MRVLLRLAISLIRAGGWLRAGSVAGAHVLGVAILLGAQALPDAVHPGGLADNPVARNQFTAIVGVLVVPVAILLLTVGRMSSGVRDRRLASLRLLGMSTGRSVIVAALENAIVALAGSLAGLAAFLALTPAVERWVAAGPAWFVAPLRTTPTTAALTIAGVVALSVVVATAPMGRLLTDPRSERTESARRTPSPWRLVLLVPTTAVLGWLTQVDLVTTSNKTVALALLTGGLLGAVTIALAAPVLASWAARVLVRRRSTGLLLAGRAIQVAPASASRLVAGIGVVVYLVMASAAVLGAFQSTPQYRYAEQVLTDGPQEIRVMTAGADTRPPIEDLDAVADHLMTVEGVHGWVPDYVAVDAQCDPASSGAPCAEIFIGTCEQLQLLIVAEGCRDDRAAAVEWLPSDRSIDEIGVPPDVDDLGGVVELRTLDEEWLAVPLDAEPIRYDPEATLEEWVYPSQIGVFVPIDLVREEIGEPARITMIADGGTAVQAEVITMAEQLGMEAWAYPTWDYDEVLRVRTVVWTLCAIVVGIGLFALALTSVDRALERRRAVARQVAIGVPLRVLRTGQVLQTLIPLLASLALALPCGWLLFEAYRHVVELPVIPARDVLTVFLAATAIGTVVVSAVTLPLTRSRLTADLLRTE
ncbi:hypothetical protein IM660_01060 [Ruania alkalisoli]|uniref:FtsX-like permease family protein n=1 Tax=Ruania alkalisoli TaxID=2779775 RepID=A0A7M1SV34_9MICO|nr:FtsX-like permease family protein [Ruania alkalisoli]QOR70937.1 hypothetical protein IM660_01060 [Ruania alkalisoli]